MSPSFTELLTPTLKRPSIIDCYWGHIGDLGYKPCGNLLIIGAAADLMEVALAEIAMGGKLEPDILSVTTVNERDYNKDHFTIPTTQARDMFVCSYPDLKLKVLENTHFQNLPDHLQFDSILFIAAWAIFISTAQYEHIPRLLKPGGHFVGTTNYVFDKKPDLTNYGCEIDVRKCDYDHPRVHGHLYWSKIYIHKPKR